MVNRIIIVLWLLQFEMLELNQLDRALLPCPLLLDQQSYLPDTVELTEDIAAREYWLECFMKGVHKVLIHCKIKWSIFLYVWHSCFYYGTTSMDWI